ncbi:MAG: hypothetical protein ABIB04_05290 [Patescibacteria group bacterium]
MYISYNEIRLIELALQDFPEHHTDRKLFVAAVMAALHDTNAPNLTAISDEEFRLIANKLKKLRADGTLSFDEACVVSMVIAKRELGWKPFSLPTLRQLANSPKNHIVLINAIGILAIAWQTISRPDHQFMKNGNSIRFSQN